MGRGGDGTIMMVDGDREGYGDSGPASNSGVREVDTIRGKLNASL